MDTHGGGAIDPVRQVSATDAIEEGEVPLVVVMEQVLLSALREQDAADAADVAKRRAEFLAEAGLRFGVSLDQELTYAAIADLELPGLRAWCVVDVIGTKGGLRRIAVLHSDDDKHARARALIDRWIPSLDDAIGVPAVSHDRVTIIVTDGAETALCAGVTDPETLRVLGDLGAGALLVVPMMAHDVLVGAITFINRVGAPVHTSEEIRFGEALAARCAQALESARLYAAARASLAEADAARAEAEAAWAEAERASRAKSDFLAVMSHELRTPLNAISGYTELVQLGIYGPVPSDQATALARVQATQRHLLGLINGVLNFSRIEAGAVAYAIDVVSLDAVLSACEVLIFPQAHAKQLNIRYDSCSPQVVARADPDRVRQIVVNLLSNAVKFTEPNGQVTLTCTRTGSGTVVVSVADTGRGIAPDLLGRVFYPFVQGDAGLTRTQEGTGLGLSISRELARGMGGDIKVESALGVGSTFTLTLPAA